MGEHSDGYRDTWANESVVWTRRPTEKGRVEDDVRR